MLIKERLAQMAIQRGLEQENTEQTLLRLYDEFCATGSEACLDDLIRGAEHLGNGIAYGRLMTSTHFRSQDFEDYLQHISALLAQKLRKEQAAGERQENIVFTVRRFYDMRSRDLRDWLAVHRNGIPDTSLDGLNETEDGKKRDVIADPFSEPEDDRHTNQEKEALFGQLVRMYLNIVLEHDGEPQRPIALLFSRLLYQIESQFNPEEIDLATAQKAAKDKRKTLDEYTKWALASMEVQNPATTSSVKWGTRKMQGKTIRELTDAAQTSLQTHYDPRLKWGQEHLSALEEDCPYTDDSLWQDVIYTDTFTEKKTAYWADLLHAYTAKQLVFEIENDPELDSEVMKLDSPVKSLMIRLGKEHHHGTSHTR